jgi:leader peptidase (prepilin peptidase)/N-methyltransferase
VSATILVLCGLGCGVAALASHRQLGRWVEGEPRRRRSVGYVALAVLGGVGAAALAEGWLELAAYTLLAIAGAALVVIDLAARRLPDAIIGPGYLMLFGLLALTAAVSGQWSRFGRAAAAGAVLLLAYYLLAILRRSGLGFGDVKLAGLLGGFLGWLGWSQTVLGTLAGFAMGGFCATALLLSGRTARDGAFPYGPSMIVGAAIGAAFGAALWGAA